MYMMAAGLGCQMALVGSGWANCCFGCTRKSYLRTVGGSFLSIKVVWALKSSLLAENVD